MTDTTTELIRDLEAVTEHVPRTVARLKAGVLSPVTQHAFGAMLTELGEKMHRHADRDTPPNGRHALREPPTIDNPEPS
jgi:hypothetical protein